MQSGNAVGLVILLSDLSNIVEIMRKFRHAQVRVNLLQRLLRVGRQILVADKQNLLIPPALMEPERLLADRSSNLNLSF